MEIKRDVEQGFSGKAGGLYDILTQLKNGMLPVSGETYYVHPAGNGTTGLSWENAFTSVGAAITASNAYLAKGGNTFKRNKIYVGTYGYIEHITVMPKQCDVIGVGSALCGKTNIIGTHTIATAGQDCHWYNIRFYSMYTGVGASPVFKAIVGCNGLEFWNCEFKVFDGNALTTHGLHFAGAIHDYKVIDCKVFGNPPPPIGILIDGPGCAGGEIKDCLISAETTGIQYADGVTGDWGTIIKGNTIVRLDPNSVAQMTTGILISDTNSRCHTVFVDNYISAVDAINFVGGSYQNMDKWLAIGNTIVEAATSTMETVIVDG